MSEQTFRNALSALLLAATARGGEPVSPLDRILAAEKNLLAALAQTAPLVETYIQEPAPDGSGPARDHYFLGRMRIAAGVEYEPLVRHGLAAGPEKGRMAALLRRREEFGFEPRGFAQMAFADVVRLDRATYRFEIVRREFLGEVRCVVVDVQPLDPGAEGRFQGRLWAEDQEWKIVRLNGIYTRPKKAKRSPGEHYFHFDSWRTHTAAGWWVPAWTYVEESAGPDPRVPAFKAQTRIWGYAPESASASTRATLHVASGANEEGAATAPLSPLESQREWERQAEENVLERLERAGLVGIPGPVEQVLNSVARNLVQAAGLGFEIRCRVLVTTPLESFAIGNTLVLSRGLIDVLPDEGALALVLAGELAHIALGHRTPTEFAFHNRTMLRDSETLQRLRLARSPDETARAAKKAVEILERSPYRKLEGAGLFLKAVAARRTQLPRLLESNLGNRLAGAELRFRELADGAPPLEEQKLEQIAALPLGSRVQVSPWSNRTVLLEARPLALLNAREKMPFEITPFRPHLARVERRGSPASAAVR